VADFKALRVPIALLHQKVYNTAHRLDKWEGITFPPEKPVVRQTSHYNGWFDNRVNQPNRIYDVMHNLFDSSFAYLRQYFYLIDGVDKCVCRGCGKQADTLEERHSHFSCYRVIREILEELRQTRICAICGDATNPIACNSDYDGAPVCSDTCMYCWDCMSPDLFEFFLEKKREKEAK